MTLKIDNKICVCIVFMPSTIPWKQSNFSSKEDAETWVDARVKDALLLKATEYTVFFGEYTERHSYKLEWTKQDETIEKVIEPSKAAAVSL